MAVESKVAVYDYRCFTSQAGGRQRFKKIAAYVTHLDNAARNVDGRPPLSLLAQQEEEREFHRRREVLRAQDQAFAEIITEVSPFA